MNPFRKNNTTRTSKDKDHTYYKLCSLFWLQRLTKPKAIACLLSAILFIIYSGHRIASYKLNTTEWVKSPVNEIYRECPAPSYPTLTNTNTVESAGKICMTTLTDAKKGSPLQRFVRWRNFDALLDMTWPNKQAYCNKHGYYLYNESDSLYPNRPPSWSKIRAAQRLLTEEKCDWVFWLDADTVIMNSEKTLESFLPSHPDKDLIITRQKGGSFNAGAWLIRNSDWSQQFLQHWWDMKEFVQPPGLSVSGDNDALKAYLNDQMDPAEFKKHVIVPARCQFNSDASWITPSEQAIYQKDPSLIEQIEYYKSAGKYHKGDLIAHVAGKNNKIDTTAMLLKDAV